MKTRTKIILALTVLLALACGKQKNQIGATLDLEKSLALREQSKQESLEDLEQLSQLVENHYAPLEYKERRFGYKWKDLVAKHRDMIQNSKSDAESFGILKKLLRNLEDGHVGIYTLVGKPSIGTSHSLPFDVDAIGNGFYISKLEHPSIEKEIDIAVGDEVVEIGSDSPESLLNNIKKYESMGNELSDRRLAMFLTKRPLYMVDIAPKSARVTVKLKRNDKFFERSFFWQTGILENEFLKSYFKPQGNSHLNSETNSELNSFTKMSLEKNLPSAYLRKVDDEIPFFYGKPLSEKYSLKRVFPNRETLEKNGLPASKKGPNHFAAIYKYKGKNYLLIRQPSYMPENMEESLAWYKSVLEDYEPFVEGLAIDQTQNPGGMVMYANEFVSLFAKNNSRGLAFHYKADKKWLATFIRVLANVALMKDGAQGIQIMKASVENAYKGIEDSYDRNEKVTAEAFTLFNYPFLNNKHKAYFTKPIVMLIDENAGSCGDLVPLLMQKNGLARLYGQKTMGLGGNVEAVGVLPHSQAALRLTRSLFRFDDGVDKKYLPDGKLDSEFVENNGVSPDVPYKINIEDVRNGFVNYFEGFANELDQMARTERK